MPYIVLDIETVPDTDLWKPAEKKPRSRAKKDEFPPLYAHRPICIGVAALSDDFLLQYIGVTASDDERGLITAMSDWLAQQGGTIVTFNGRGFDIPVLMLRSLRHGLNHQFITPGHRRRYDEDNHLDLMAAFTEYGANGRAGYSLEMMSVVMGLGRKSDMDGSMVAQLYNEGKIEHIKRHCMQDIARTAFLAMRYKLVRGNITLQQYQVAAKMLYDKCVELQLTGVLFAADPERVTLQASAPAA